MTAPTAPDAGEPLSAEFTVAADHPAIAGHFPGNPIVPAVLLLDLGCAALWRLRPQLGAVLELRSAKFMRPVRPGERVQVSFTPSAGDPGLLRLAFHGAEGPVAQAQLRFGGAR